MLFERLLPEASLFPQWLGFVMDGAVLSRSDVSRSLCGGHLCLVHIWLEGEALTSWVLNGSLLMMGATPLEVSGKTGQVSSRPSPQLLVLGAGQPGRGACKGLCKSASESPPVYQTEPFRLPLVSHSTLPASAKPSSI